MKRDWLSKREHMVKLIAESPETRENVKNVHKTKIEMCVGAI